MVTLEKPTGKNYIIKKSTLKDIADAIRLKTDTNKNLVVSQFASMIKSIKDGMKLNYVNFVFSEDQEPEDKTKYWVKRKEPNSVEIRPENSENCEILKQESSNVADGMTDIISISVGDNIYIFGIMDDEDPDNPKYKYSLKVYDLSDGSISTVFTDSDKVCKGVSCTLVGKKIYMFGGEQSQDDYVSYIRVLDTENNNQITTISELLAPMTGIATTAIGDMIYLIGGKLNNGDVDECYDTIYSFNTKDNSLKKVSNGTLPKKLYNIQACSSETGNIYIFGGKTIDDIANDTIYRFNPNSTDSDIRFKELNQSLPDFLSVDGLRCVPMRTKIYLFGNQYSGQFYELNTLSDHLKSYKSMGEIIHNSGVCFAEEYNTIYIIGGLQPSPTTQGSTDPYIKYTGHFEVLFNPITVQYNTVLITTDSYADSQLILNSDRVNIYEGMSELYYGNSDNIGITTEVYKYNEKDQEWQILQYYTGIE